MTLPTISVILPRRAEDSSEEAIRAILRSDYPRERLEILEAVGHAPSRQRNQAAAAAHGDIVYFLDNDSLVTPSLFTQVARHYAVASDRIVGVGGPNLTPETDTFLQQLAGYALASPFAHFKMAARYIPLGGLRDAGEQELILCNLSVRRDVFAQAGGFDERLYPNEENELINRLRKRGLRWLYDPAAVIYRSRRASVTGFLRQLCSYGRGRTEQMRVEGVSLKSLLFLLPVGLLAYFALLPVLGTWLGWQASLPLMMYGAGAGLSALIQAGIQRRKWRLAPLLPVWYLLMHLSYGVGLLRGWFAPRRAPTVVDSGEIQVMRRLAFGGYELFNKICPNIDKYEQISLEKGNA